MATAGEKGIGRLFVIAVPYLWLLVLFLVPFLIVLKISLSQDVIAQPPYAPLLDLSQGWAGFVDFLSQLNFDNYVYVLDWNNEFLDAYGSSLIIAAVSTVLLLLVGYPIAYAMARAPRTLQPTLLMLVILPFWTSFLIRVYAWIGILSQDGLLNQALQALGLIDAPLEILNTDLAVYIGIVYSYLPFMVLPLYAALEKLDGTLLEAAEDLGCPPMRAFWLVTFPLSLPGVAAGCLLCFIPAVGEFVIPDLLGGSDTLMIGKSLWTEFTVNRSWTASSAVAVLLLIVLVVPIVIYQNIQARQLEAGK
ncbi:ABC transporter permease [Aquabacter spiritensis]|uniref:Putrescine transport system permease protein n=1 Tax=Aquabacter spiritensis TaxID=933073 RepID=A0A4V2UX49_9HYPH|nr:ABC transporter permease subunit [Aquabacter spiritensis]TCT02158.1 putrescine transport system permease protein [Aquabacter spiritensis]